MRLNRLTSQVRLRRRSNNHDGIPLLKGSAITIGRTLPTSLVVRQEFVLLLTDLAGQTLKFLDIVGVLFNLLDISHLTHSLSYP